MNSTLIGRWKLERADPALGLDPGAIMAFHPDGQLLYAIPSNGGHQVIHMTFRQEGDCLITDQPSSPREERTKFALHGDSLELDYGGLKAVFTRADN